MAVIRFSRHHETRKVAHFDFWMGLSLERACKQEKGRIGGIPMALRLVITVKEIRGHCPVYRAGDRIVVDDGYRLNLKETDNVCLHSLSSLMPYYVALSKGVDPVRLGLSRDGRAAYVQCLDPCDYTGGGTVVFAIEKEG